MATDFFDRQDKARRSTKVLVLYFLAGVVLLIVALYFALLFAFGLSGGSIEVLEGRHRGLWQPELFLGTAAVTSAIIFFGSLFKTLQLSRGGSAVAVSLGGRLVNSSTTDPDERKLMNVVEEMSIASGVPMPQVYVLDRETGINAFAAGHSTSDAAVGVTRGCIKVLNRDELQGVIAHEFSHILNGDMRLNLRLMGLIFGIFCIAVIGRVLLETRGGSRRDKNPLPLLGLIFLALGWIGVFFGRLIQAAVSRQREFLADAAAVQFTRNPAGIAGALKKIGGLLYGSKLKSAHASEASHLFFGNAMGASFSEMMATHPPLPERIRAIDPGFDGKFPRVTLPDGREPDADEIIAEARRSRRPFPFEMPGFPEPHRAVSPLVSPPVIAASAVVSTLGVPSPAHLQYAETLRDAFPPRLREAAHDPLGASALVYALVISPDSALRAQQLKLLEAVTSPGVRQETERLLAQAGEIALRARLPLIDLALPALRQMSFEQYQRFSEALRQLIESDSEIDLFEYVLQKVAVRHLESQFKSVRKPVVQFYALRPLIPDCAILLSALAHAGSDDPQLAAAAFQQGAAGLMRHAQAPMAFAAVDQCELGNIDAALDRLNQAVPQIKKNVLNACAQTVAADGLIHESEAELLRAVADTLDCPLPPLVQPG